jgi:transcriptional accessory protein Tex/SPT6
MASNHVHFVDDQDLNPIVYAEQFGDPDPTKAQSPEELLRRARMILSTELGKDPLLRNQIRKVFQEDARISVEPTERGITKIDEHHMYYVSANVPSYRLYIYHLLFRISNISTTRTSKTCWIPPSFLTFSLPKRNT